MRYALVVFAVALVAMVVGLVIPAGMYRTAWYVGAWVVAFVLIAHRRSRVR